MRFRCVCSISPADTALQPFAQPGSRNVPTPARTPGIGVATTGSPAPKASSALSGTSVGGVALLTNGSSATRQRDINAGSSRWGCSTSQCRFGRRGKACRSRFSTGPTRTMCHCSLARATALDTVNRLYGLQLNAFEVDGFFARHAEKVDQVKTSEDVVVSRVGRDLYEKFFRG